MCKFILIFISKPEDFEIFKLTQVMNIFMDDFTDFKYENLLEISEYTIVGFPFFINHDGSIIL